MLKELFNYLATIVKLQQQLLDLLMGNAKVEPIDEWLDNTDVKQLLKISDRTLHRLRNTGNLPGKKIGGKWFYPRKALLKYFEKL